MEEVQWIEFKRVHQERILVHISSIIGIDEQSGLNGVVMLLTTNGNYDVEADYNELKECLVGLISSNCYNFPQPKPE